MQSRRGIAFRVLLRRQAYEHALRSSFSGDLMGTESLKQWLKAWLMESGEV